MNKYQPIIGIEVHIELKTKSKMFCGCSANHFRVKPNSHTCPVCLGLPGALPVPNKKAIEWCLLIGLSLGCKINKESKFDRKNYFYPDLPKGYQISQYDQPFCKNGGLKILTINHQPSTIKINRVHMEEDTAKLIHKKINGKKVSLIDFNRSGVPLVEIVTEPDIHSSDEAIAYLKKLQQVIRYLGVSDCDMEKGSMRCEVNISLQKLKNSKTPELQDAKIPKFKELPKYKVEIKNINSFKFVKKAIEYEIKRQVKILDSAKIPPQETRGYDEKKRITFSQRSKEEAYEYRYFPEPDIPPIKLSNQFIKKLSNQLVELPDEKIKRYINDFGLSEYNAKILTFKKETAEYFEQAIKELKIYIKKTGLHLNYKAYLKRVAKEIVNKRVNINNFNPKKLIVYLLKQESNKINDIGELAKIVKKILAENQKAVWDYKNGKKAVLGFLIGQAMRKSKGKASAQAVQKIMVEKLKVSS